MGSSRKQDGFGRIFPYGKLARREKSAWELTNLGKGVNGNTRLVDKDSPRTYRKVRETEKLTQTTKKNRERQSGVEAGQTGEMPQRSRGRQSKQASEHLGACHCLWGNAHSSVHKLKGAATNAYFVQFSLMLWGVVRWVGEQLGGTVTMM